MKRFTNCIGCNVELHRGVYPSTKNELVMVESSDKFKIVTTEPEYVVVHGHNIDIKVHYRSIRKIYNQKEKYHV